MQITIEALARAPLDAVWRAWTTPWDITQWNAASDDWHTTSASVDLRVGGGFSSRMEAKDGSMGFDFAGTYTQVMPQQRLECSFGDRSLRVEFLPGPGGVTVRETFDAEETHSVEQQRQGWQAILDNFVRHVESGAAAATGTEPVEARSDRRSRLIAAPPAAVFAAMSDPVRVARWWGPAGFRNTIHEFDFRPGGRWRLTMHGPDGRDHPNESRFVRIEPGRLLAIEHFSGHHFVLEIALHAEGAGTRVAWCQTFDTAAHHARIADFVANANEENLDRLAAEVVRPGPP